MSLSGTIQHILETYRPFSLEKAETVRLMHRVDTKYILRTIDAVGLLYDIRKYYHVLEIASQRKGTYTSVYYDTSDRQMFYAHITGRLPRYKVRERLYSQNGLKFFEIKQKSNKGRTSKRRKAISECSSEANNWIHNQSPFHADELTPTLIIYFDRITLINNQQTERVTLDFNLHFCTPSGDVTPVYDRVAIIELKQDKTVDSPLKKYLRRKSIHSGGISKYCVGMFLTGSETNFKRYKPKFSHFIKTQNERTY